MVDLTQMQQHENGDYKRGKVNQKTETVSEGEVGRVYAMRLCNTRRAWQKKWKQSETDKRCQSGRVTRNRVV